MHLGQVTLHVKDCGWLVVREQLAVLYLVLAERPCIEVEHVYISTVHADEEVVVIERLRGQKTWHIQAADLAVAWVRDLDLNFTITEVFQVPQFKHIGHINRHKKALVRNEGHPNDLIVVGVIHL